MNNRNKTSTIKTYTFKGNKISIDIAKEFKKEKPSIDTLLDQYNDYMTLYKMFGDTGYLLKANEAMMQIKAMS